MSSFALKWGKESYQVTIDSTTTPASLMTQVESLTGVPVANQKLMAKKGWKGVLSSTTKLKVKPGKTTLNLMGTATATITATTEASSKKSVFVEDMSKNDAQKLVNATPPGLTNLGNTCYMNSTLQCLRFIPELRTALAASASLSSQSPEVKFVQDLNRLYRQMDNSFAPDAVTPQEFVFTLRHQFSMFADRAQNGAYVQQDADEFYSTVMRCLETSLTRSQVGSNPALKDVFGDRDGFEPSNSVVDALFSIGFETKEKCTESEEEAIVTRYSKEQKLKCNIVGGGGSDTKVNHLYQGLELGLVGEIEKRSEKLGRNAVWKRETKIKRLPRYLCVQYMRFYWKNREATTHDSSTGTACKMKRRVQFHDTLDMFKFCSEDLQKTLLVPRNASVDLKSHQEEEGENSSSKGESKKDDSTKPVEKKQKTTNGSEDTPTPMEIDDDDEDAAELAAALAMSTGAPAFAGYGLPANFQGQYEMFAIVTHIGRSVNSGHYMGWVKSETEGTDAWLRFNDSEVDPCQFVDIKELDGGTGDNDMVYLALYRPMKFMK